jgi:RimJ/RimL family protein N-acetyltransferase
MFGMTSIQRDAPWPATLLTARLVLRPIERADVPAVSRTWTDPAVTRYLGGPVAPAEVARREERCPGAPNVFSVVRSSDAAVLGTVEVKPVGDTHSGHNATGHTEVGYMFLPEYWGRGYGREAVSAAAAWALDDLSPAPPVVIAVTQEANKESCRLLEAIGMTLVARFVAWEASQLMYSVDRVALSGGRRHTGRQRDPAAGRPVEGH